MMFFLSLLLERLLQGDAGQLNNPMLGLNASQKWPAAYPDHHELRPGPGMEAFSIPCYWDGGRVFCSTEIKSISDLWPPSLKTYSQLFILRLIKAQRLTVHTVQWARLMKAMCACWRGCSSISAQLNIRRQSRGSSSRKNIMGLFTGFHPSG